MEAKKKGRKPLKEGEKVMLVSVYLKKEDKEAIVAKYGSVTNSVKQEVLPRLPKKENI
tara:strand:- start:36 stop:209 length:174 start_codon:yes stop_codon:yes gene_type:complete